MFDTIIWHIGTPKTGSSYLQNVLQDNQSFLFEKNIIYKTNDKEVWHRSLFTEFKSAQTTSRTCEIY